MDAWYPRFDERGLRIASGHVQVHIDGVFYARGIEPRWDNGLLWYRDHPTGILMCEKKEVGPPCNMFDVKNGRWCAVNNVGGVPHIMTSHGPRIPHYVYAIHAPLGDGYVACPHEGAGLFHVSLDGQRFLLDARPAQFPRVKDGLLAYQAGEGIAGSAGMFNYPVGFWPIPVEAAGDRFVLFHDHEKLMLGLWNEPLVYVVAKGITNHPDVFFDGQFFHVCWNPGRSDEQVLRAIVKKDKVLSSLVKYVPEFDTPDVVVPVPELPKPEPPKELESMWTDKHAALLEQYVKVYGIPTREDDYAREWTRKFAEQLAYSFPTEGWGHKAGGGGRPPSTDVVATRSPFIGYDLIVGLGAENRLELRPGPIDLRGQEFIPVTPKNHLGTTFPSPSPNPSPTPTPVVNCKFPDVNLAKMLNEVEEILSRVNTIERRLGEIASLLTGQEAAIQHLIVRGEELTDGLKAFIIGERETIVKTIQDKPVTQCRRFF